MEDLVIERLEKSFGETRAVDAISFEAKPGQCVAILGPSGCGKTTTLRCVAGLETPDGGSMRLGDTVLWAERGPRLPPERRQMGMVFQSYALWPHLSLFDNVAYPLEVRGVRGDALQKAAASAIDVVGMAGREEAFPSELSGGQQQRVALARSIVAEPRVVLFDEPLSNLDRALRDEMRVELRRIISHLALTSLYVTHDQSEAFAIADVVIVMNRGKIQQIGAPVDVFTRPANRFVADFLGAESALYGVVSNSSDRGSEVALEGSDYSLNSSSMLPVGTSVVVAVHPDRVRLGRAQEDARTSATASRSNRLPVAVEQVTFLGGQQEVVGSCQGHRIKARFRTAEIEDVMGTAQLPVGSQVAFELFDSDITIFKK